MQQTAKLFMHGGSQAVCLPEGFQLPGEEVRVSRDGDKVVLEPLAGTAEGRTAARTPAEMAAIWAKIDAIRQGDTLFPDSDFEDPPVQPDPIFGK